MNDRQLLIEGITKDMIQYLMEDYGMELQGAFRKLYNSETYEKLQDERTGLYLQSSGYHKQGSQSRAVFVINN